MKIGILSDIHGNCVAFEAALQDVRRLGIDRMVCLGDAIQGGAQPREAINRLRDLTCPVVLGNADAFLLEVPDDDREPVTEEQLEVRAWTLSQLDADDVRWIQSFQETVAVDLADGSELLCFHGSPRSYFDVILPETTDDEVLGLMPHPLPRILTGGHTHLQQVRRLGSSIFLNPGSIGLAFDRRQPEGDLLVDPLAEYAVITVDGENLSIDFRRVPYSTEEYVEAVLASNRPGRDALVASSRGSQQKP